MRFRFLGVFFKEILRHLHIIKVMLKYNWINLMIIYFGGKYGKDKFERQRDSARISL